MLDRPDSSAELLWVCDWMERRAHGRPVDRDVNYIEAGLVDSLAMINLILDVEAAFSLRLTDAVFADPRFFLIGGLAEILVELRGAPGASQPDRTAECAT